MVKQIIVPTDFSDAAANAYQYAQRVAAQQGARLTLLHVYHPSFDLDNPYLDTPEVDFGDLKQQALDAFADSYRLSLEEENDFGPVELELVIGFAGEEIARLSSSTNLIVMGTTGAGGLMDRLFGSVSSYAARHAHCPVLLVPEEAVFKPPFRVMYASNDEPADESTLWQAMRETGLEPEVIHFVHAELTPGADCRVAKWQHKQLLQAESPELDLHYVQIDCEDILDGLLQYGEQHQINLIIMGTAHRSFLERLFHRSVTKGMVLQTDIPLLVMHYDD